VSTDTGGNLTLPASFPCTISTFPVGRNSFATTAKCEYPLTTVPTYYSGDGQIDLDGSVHAVSTGTLDQPANGPSPPYRLTHVLSTVITCDESGKRCSGSWWGIYTGVVAPAYIPPSGPIPSGWSFTDYNAGTMHQVPCQWSKP